MKTKFKLMKPQAPFLGTTDFELLKEVEKTPAIIEYFDTIDKKYHLTTLSYLNNSNIFDEIQSKRYQKNRNYDSTKQKHNYIPDLTIHQNIENLKISDANSEYEKKYSALEFYRNLLDKTYHKKGLYNLGTTTEIEGIKINSYIRINAFPFLFVHNATDLFKAYIVIRGVDIPMDVSISSKNNDGTRNYIIKYPDYLLNQYKENYLSTRWIKIYDESSSIKFYTSVNESNQIINQPTFYNMTKTSYTTKVSSLNRKNGNKVSLTINNNKII